MDAVLRYFPVTLSIILPCLRKGTESRMPPSTETKAYGDYDTTIKLNK